MIQNVVFLRPPQRATMDHENRTHELPPLSNDELVRGIIHLNCPTERHIDGIRVHLKATMSLAHFDSGYNNIATSWETNVFMERVLEIGVPMRLSKLNSQRAASQSVSRAMSPSVTPGGGGRHSDHHSHDFFRGFRGVSRGRSSQTPSLFRSRGSSILPEEYSYSSRSRTPSHVRTPVDDSGSSTPHYAHASQLTEEDLAHVTQRLEQHGLEDDEEHRGRGRHRYGSGTQSPYDVDERRGRSKASYVEVIRDGGEDGLELSKGVHMFEFAFIIPADAPPYDRSSYGKVRYTVKVTVLGGGRARSNVEEWRDFFPMVNPAADGGVTPLTVLFNDVHDTVGMLSVACTSNNISVGGMFNIDIHSPSPPPDLIVYMVRVSLYTTIEVHSSRRGKQVSPVQKRRLFEKGVVPSPDKVQHHDADRLPGYIHYAGSNSAWTVQGVARIPDDNAIRPSTMPGTRSPLRFHHVLVVEVVHSRHDPTVPDCLGPDGRRKLKVFTLRQSVVIPSCCCALDAVTLPAYSARQEDAPSVPQLKHLTGTTWEQIVKANQSRGESHNMCVCGMSLADLSAAEQAMLPPPDPTNLMVQQGQGRKIGEYAGGEDPLAGPGPSSSSSSSAGAANHHHRLASPSPMPSPSMRPTSSRGSTPLQPPTLTDEPPAYSL